MSRRLLLSSTQVKIYFIQPALIFHGLSIQGVDYPRVADWTKTVNNEKQLLDSGLKSL